MIAVWKHELKNYFHSLTAYIFGAFLLAFIGLGALRYNIQAAVSNFEFVLSYGCLIFVVIVPILTMRVIAEERRQKTDQAALLPAHYHGAGGPGQVSGSAGGLCRPPVSDLPVPADLLQYGDVYLPTSYGSILAFLVLGAALIALGMFLSSLTDNQGFAAGIGIAVILFNYYSVSLSEYVSSTAFGSMVAICVLILALWGIIRYLTKNETLAYGVSFLLLAVTVVAYQMDAASFEGLLPKIMTQLSLFERFYVFVNGVFDMTAIVYYVAVIVFFLFLSVQSLEKRRYN